VILAISCIGTGVASFPVVKKQNESVALADVGGRLLEVTVIVVGIIRGHASPDITPEGSDPPAPPTSPR